MSQTPQDVVEHHMGAFESHDMAEIVSDYADDAVFILPHEVLQGREAIYGFFAPGQTGENPPRLDYKIHPAEGPVVVADWTLGEGSSNEMRGKDVFVVHDGKIRVQTLYIHGPAPAAD